MQSDSENAEGIEGSGIAGTVQSLREDELIFILSIMPKREMGQSVRDAIWLMFNHGYEVTLASRRCDVSYRHVSNAEKKILAIHDGIMKTYVDKYLYGKKTT